MAERLQSQKILVVDDDAEWRQFLCEALGQRHSVVTAANGEEALVIARTVHPALIFLDVMIPGGKDGFTLFCDLRKDQKTRDIPVIFLTEINPTASTLFDADVLKQYLGESPAAFLEKPISKDAVLRAVQKVLGPCRG